MDSPGLVVHASKTVAKDEIIMLTMPNRSILTAAI